MYNSHKMLGVATMDVQKLRDEIPVLANLTYLNTGWSGPPPRRVAQALKDRVDLELEEGPTSLPVQESGRATQAQARQAAARLFNADPEAVMVTRNTTEGLNIVLSGLDWQEGDEIITCNLEHGSVLITSLVTGERHGVKVRVVDLDPHDSAGDHPQQIRGGFHLPDPPALCQPRRVLYRAAYARRRAYPVGP